MSGKKESLLSVGVPVARETETSYIVETVIRQLSNPTSSVIGSYSEVQLRIEV